MPFSLRVEKANDAPSAQSLFYGPVLPAGRSNERTPRPFSLYRHLGWGRLSPGCRRSRARGRGKPERVWAGLLPGRGRAVGGEELMAPLWR